MLSFASLIKYIWTFRVLIYRYWYDLDIYNHTEQIYKLALDIIDSKSYVFYYSQNYTNKILRLIISNIIKYNI
jgi:hypothetical protein